ncbi:MAG TPA: phage holin family protein [Candidatus Saccharimonadales bacterium]|nr:phage holin family protein [Candidatus Saccharimonadales bacterium]
MKHGLLYRFLVRWLVCALGLWIAASLLSSHVSIQTTGSYLWAVLVAGFILAAVNAIIKPLIVLLSLPAILVTLGLFMVVINGVTVWLASWLYRPLEINDFWGALLAGVVIGLVNYLVTAILEIGRKQ